MVSNNDAFEKRIYTVFKMHNNFDYILVTIKNIYSNQIRDLFCLTYLIKIAKLRNNHIQMKYQPFYIHTNSILKLFSYIHIIYKYTYINVPWLKENLYSPNKYYIVKKRFSHWKRLNVRIIVYVKKILIMRNGWWISYKNSLWYMLCFY